MNPYPKKYNTPDLQSLINRGRSIFNRLPNYVSDDLLKELQCQHSYKIHWSEFPVPDDEATHQLNIKKAHGHLTFVKKKYLI